MDIILKKIENDLKRIIKKDFDIQIKTLDKNTGVFVPGNNIIDFQNSIVYVFYIESNPSTTTKLKSYEKTFSVSNGKNDSLIKFLTPIKIDDNIAVLKYILVKIIR